MRVPHSHSSEQLQQHLQQEIVVLETSTEELQSSLQIKQDQQQLQKTDVLSLKTEIQVLLAEQKNLNQLVAKQSPKTTQNSVRLMQSLRLTTQGKAHATVIEEFLAKWLQAQLLEGEQPFQEGVARQLRNPSQPPFDKGRSSPLFQRGVRGRFI